MKTLIQFRNEFFALIGKSRLKRTLFIAFSIAIFWCAIDYFLYNNLAFNLTHDIAVLVLSVLVERMLPWGKIKS